MSTKNKLVAATATPLNWVFGVLFGLSGLISLIESPLVGICLIVISLLLLPPVRNTVYAKTNKELSFKARAISIFVLFIVSSIFAGQSLEKKADELKAQKAEEEVQKVAKAKARQDNIDYFNGHKEEILSSASSALSEKNYQLVMNQTSKYLPANDAGINEIYSQAKSALDAIKKAESEAKDLQDLQRGAKKAQTVKQLLNVPPVINGYFVLWAVEVLREESIDNIKNFINVTENYWGDTVILKKNISHENIKKIAINLNNMTNLQIKEFTKTQEWLALRESLKQELKAQKDNIWRLGPLELGEYDVDEDAFFVGTNSVGNKMDISPPVFNGYALTKIDYESKRMELLNVMFTVIKIPVRKDMAVKLEKKGSLVLTIKITGDLENTTGSFTFPEAKVINQYAIIGDSILWNK